MTFKFLLLDDNTQDAEVIKAALISSGIDCELLRVQTRSNFIEALDSNVFDLILASTTLPDFDGLDALTIARNKNPDLPFIFVSSSLDERVEIEALKNGATSFVLKERLGCLVSYVERALQEAKESRVRKQTSHMSLEQKRLLEMIASGCPLFDCLEAVCLSLSRLNKSTRACFLLPDEQRLAFTSSITPDFAPSFGQGLLNSPINDLCIGTCGEAVYCGQPVTCADIANDERWSLGWRQLCVAHGILACHSTPVLGTDGLPLGSLMLCFDSARLPSDWEYQLASFGTQVASIAFERDRSGKQLRQSEEKYRTLFESIDEGFCICQMLFEANGRPIDYRFLKVNPAFEIMTGLKEATGKTARELVPNLEAFWFEIYGSVVQTRQPVRFENQSMAMNRWFDVNAFCIDEAQSHQFAVLFTDISTRKQFEQERSRFLAVGSDLQVIAGSNGRFQWVSPTFERTLGWTVEEMTSRPWTDFIHPDDISQSTKETDSVFLGKEIFAFENRYRHKDGSYRTFLWKAQPYPEEQIVYGAAVDITERKQAEEALRQSQSRFRLMVESAKEYAIFTLSLNGIITSWNSGAERLLGYTETEALGCKGQMIFTSEDNELNRAEWEMQTALTEGRAENERWHVRKGGSRFWASGLMMPLLSETGNTQGFVKILQDKTEQRQASERLRLLYETTSDLLATPQPLQLMSNLFNKLSQSLQLDYYYNYIIEKKDNQLMLHLKNYEGISQEAAQSIEWIEFGQYLCGLVATERRQIVLDKEQISTHPNARLVCSMGITSYAGQPLIVQGRFLGTLSFASRTRTNFTCEEIDLLQSVCEQMAIAIERANLIASIQQQAEQLQQANRIKDEFLAVLSHELRSPLNPILGWSKMLQTGKLDAAKTAQGLSAIERNAKLQAELIEDLLDVSRILQGKLSLKVYPVDLVPTIYAAMETVELAAQAKSIQIQARLESNVGQVLGDANRLQQIIWNLLSNAVKFTSAGGQVNITLECLDDSAQIRVSDTGKGINPDFLPHVFDHFRQEDGATTRKFGGLGLGLAIVRHLVELHGGTVEAESAGEGRGATFIVTLPLIQNPSETTLDSKLSEPSLNLDGIKVLVVDDDTDTREFIAFMLSTYGAKVTAVSSGAEALAIFTQNRPDVLVSDIGMPQIDGYMLMRQLRTLPPEEGGQIPAIALTAYAGEVNQQQALQAGFGRHVSKPIEPLTLIAAIAQLLNPTATGG